jgi:methyltransferase-like protein
LIGKNIIYNKQEKCLRFDNNIYNLSNSEKISLLLEVFLEHPKIPLSIEYIISELEKKNSKIYVPFFVKNKGKHKTYI